jgi:alpha-galactosidase
MIRSIELHYQDSAGIAQALRLVGMGRSEHRRVVVAAEEEPSPGGVIVHARVENCSGEPIRLLWVSFELSTGFDTGSPARFFKHGYQSWSASYPVTVGDAATDTNRTLLVRLSHQSEAERPTIAPEAATSELFTIVESESSHERFLTGFVGAANQFATVTVLSPDRVTARALLDSISLSPGKTIEIEPLAYRRSDQAAARMAADWAELLGKRMNAHIRAPYQRGWCSWYQYFDQITEEALRSNLRKLQEVRREFPIDVVQIDDGFQAALGDWDRTNDKFPSGLRAIAEEIRSAGFIPGLWTAPFLATRDSGVMRNHPDWFIRNQDGEPLRAAYNPTWTRGEEKSAYALDPSHSGFTQHLEQLFSRLVHQFGYQYLKLDFLFAGALQGKCHDPNLTRAQRLRRGLETIRRGAMDQAFILGCGCPLGPAVGIVDGMRIGPDVAPYWGGDVEPGTRLAIESIVARSFMHRRLWLNDPDCLMLRASKTSLSHEERFALAAVIAVSGGMFLLSDDMKLLDANSWKLFRMVTDIGLELDNAMANQPALAMNMMGDNSMPMVVAETPRGVIHLLLNLRDSRQAVPAPRKRAGGGSAISIGPNGESEVSEKIRLPAHSARIIRS